MFAAWNQTRKGSAGGPGRGGEGSSRGEGGAESNGEREREMGSVLFHAVGNKRARGWWPEPGINYRVVVLAIVFNCGDA